MPVQTRRRIIMRLELPQQTRDLLAGFGERLGMSQVSMLSRLVVWIAEQPDDIRNAILFSHDLTGSEILTKIMQSIADAD